MHGGVSGLAGLGAMQVQDLLDDTPDALVEAWLCPLDELHVSHPELAAAIERAIVDMARDLATRAWQRGLATGVKLAQNRHAPAQLAAAVEALVKDKRVL